VVTVQVTLEPDITCSHDQNKSGSLLEGRLLSANQSNLRCIEKALIGWKKAALPKQTLLF